MKKFHFDAEKMANSPLCQQFREKEAKKQGLTENSNSSEKHTSYFDDVQFKSYAKLSLKAGFTPIERTDYLRLEYLLTSWGISSAGAVIKREGPTFVRTAADITLQNRDKAKSPKDYFRGVLRNLQKC